MKKNNIWDSPIKPHLFSSPSLKIGNILADKDSVYWTEYHSSSSGKGMIFSWDGSKIEALTPSKYNVRSSVNEYGGLCFDVKNNELCFNDFSDQSLYLKSRKKAIQKIHSSQNKRYVNPLMSPKNNTIFAIEEDLACSKNPVQKIVTLGSNPQVVSQGMDFYSMLALSPCEKYLAFLSWSHPNMPWDETKLSIVDISNNLFTEKKVIHTPNISLFQPLWSPSGKLYYISDVNGFWNIFDANNNCCLPMQAEFGQPLWQFGMKNIDFISEDKMACIYTIKGKDTLGIFDLEKNCLTGLDLPFSSFYQITTAGKNLYFIAGSPTSFPALFSLSIESNFLKKIRSFNDLNIDKSYVSVPSVIEFKVNDTELSYGLFYPPKNKHFSTKKPQLLIVKSHSGPSGRASATLNLEVQFWTSRGFAYFDVNYRGSVGFGRAFRNKIKHRWGVVDVHDCCAGATHIASKYGIDENKIVIKGSSSGGFTALCCAAFSSVFSAAVSYYGVSDLNTLADSNHNFEKHYLESLIGPKINNTQLYFDRSPINHTSTIKIPILLFHGGKDNVVSPNQTNQLYKKLLDKKKSVSYTFYENEGHGFKNPINIQDSLEKELKFYSSVFGLTLER